MSNLGFTQTTEQEATHAAVLVKFTYMTLHIAQRNAKTVVLELPNGVKIKKHKRKHVLGWFK